MTDPDSTPNWPVVRVSSHAQIEVPADRASLSVQLSSAAHPAKIDAIAELSTQRQAVQAVLDQFESVIRQTSVSRNSVYEYDPDRGVGSSGPPRSRWQASVSFNLQIADLDQIAALYNRLRRLAPEGLGGPYWSLSDDHPAHHQARAAAVRSAVVRAKELAVAAETEVVSLDWLSDADAGDVQMMAKGMRMGSDGEMDPFGADLDLEPELQTVTVSVRAQYRIRPVSYED